MQLEAKIISTHQNKSYCYQPCRDCRVCSWGTSTNEIPPNTQRCCLFPTIVTWYNSILLLKLLEQSRRKNISLHFRPLVSLCCLGLASFWNVVLPTSAPTSCHRIYQLTQGIVLLACSGESYSWSLHKKSLQTIEKANWTLAGDSKAEDNLQWHFSLPLSTFLLPSKWTTSLNRLLQLLAAVWPHSELWRGAVALLCVSQAALWRKFLLPHVPLLWRKNMATPCSLTTMLSKD